jgi:uncharacterized membrane protein
MTLNARMEALDHSSVQADHVYLAIVYVACNPRDARTKYFLASLCTHCFGFHRSVLAVVQVRTFLLALKSANKHSISP